MALTLLKPPRRCAPRPGATLDEQAAQILAAYAVEITGGRLEFQRRDRAETLSGSDDWASVGGCFRPDGDGAFLDVRAWVSGDCPFRAEAFEQAARLTLARAASRKAQASTDKAQGGAMTGGPK